MQLCVLGDDECLWYVSSQELIIFLIDLLTGIDAVCTIFFSEPSEFDCDFEEKKLCKWTQLEGSDFDVLVTEASTEELLSDPSADHNGSGKLIRPIVMLLHIYLHITLLTNLLFSSLNSNY